MIVKEVQWSSKRCSILKHKLAESDFNIVEKTSETLINKDIWIALISSN